MHRIRAVAISSREEMASPVGVPPDSGRSASTGVGWGTDCCLGAEVGVGAVVAVAIGSGVGVSVGSGVGVHLYVGVACWAGGAAVPVGAIHVPISRTVIMIKVSQKPGFAALGKGASTLLIEKTWFLAAKERVRIMSFLLDGHRVAGVWAIDGPVVVAHVDAQLAAGCREPDDLGIWGRGVVGG